MSSIRQLTHDEVTDLAPLFVLGALDTADADAVRAHLASCPEAHPELDELGGVVPYLLEDVDRMDPRPELKARILAAAAADAEADRRRLARAGGQDTQRPIEQAEKADQPGQVEPRDRVTPLGPARRSGLERSVDWAFRIAAVIAVVALVAWNVALRAQLDEAEANGRAVAAVVELAGTEGSVSAVLTGDDVRGLAAVGPDGTTRIAVTGLEPTQGSEVYTAWAIAGEGSAPVPIGDLRLTGSNGGALETSLPGASPGVTLAVTREPAPGATTPTLPIVAAGTTS